MNKKIIISFAMLSLLIVPVVVLAEDPAGIESWDKDTVKTFLGNFLNWFLGIAIGIGVLMIIYGGILWMIAGGEAEKIKTARTALIYGLIGIAVALLAFSAEKFVESLLKMQM